MSNHIGQFSPSFRVVECESHGAVLPLLRDEQGLTDRCLLCAILSDISDTYKSLNGVRPRFIYSYTLPQAVEMWESLQ